MSEPNDATEYGFVCGDHGCTPYVKRRNPASRFTDALRCDIQRYPRFALVLLCAHAMFVGYIIAELT